MDDVGSIQVITLTELASEKITNYIQKRGKGEGIKIGVRTTGCSGLAYTLEFVDEPIDDDLMTESNGIRIFVDRKSLPFITGMEMDWVKNGLNEGFDFRNPHEKNRCGCGESFTV